MAEAGTSIGSDASIMISCTQAAVSVGNDAKKQYHTLEQVQQTAALGMMKKVDLIKSYSDIRFCSNGNLICDIKFYHNYQTKTINYKEK